jgi:hypothetical protein
LASFHFSGYATQELGAAFISALICTTLFLCEASHYLIVVVLAGAIWLARAILRDKQLRKCFDEIAFGATERDFLQKLGRAKRVEKCGEFFGPLPKEELTDCSKEYFYASPFAPLLPEYFVFRFDVNNRLSCKSAYSSP